jgi:uncharacterized protein YaiI (UPF0178 family)
MLHVFIFKIVDLLILNENPLKNISATKGIMALIRNGELHSRKQLDDMLKRVALFVENKESSEKMRNK